MIDTQPPQPSQTVQPSETQSEQSPIAPKRLSKLQRCLMYIALAAATTMTSSMMLAESQLPEYRIKARALDQMLTQFANQTGLQIEMDAKQLATVSKKKCVHGRYSHDEAIALMLENTNYQAIKTNHGYRIVAK